MATVQIGIASSASIEGVAPVGGIPPTPGVASGTAAIMPQSNPAVTRAMWFWGGAVIILFLFHVGGAHLG